MPKICPACGRPIDVGVIGSESELLERLQETGKDGELLMLYRTRDGGWALTYGHGSVSPAIAQAAIRAGKLNPYSNTSDGAWWLGPTYDVGRTTRMRAAGRIGRRDIINVGDPDPA